MLRSCITRKGNLGVVGYITLGRGASEAEDRTLLFTVISLVVAMDNICIICSVQDR
jgi:hypothetical protein